MWKATGAWPIWTKQAIDAEKCSVFCLAMEKAIAAWPILITSQTENGAKMQNVFYLAMEKAIGQLPRVQPDDVTDRKKAPKSKTVFYRPWRRQLPRDQSYWRHRQKKGAKMQNRFSTWPWRRQLPRDQSWHHTGTWWSLPPDAWPASPGRWGGRTSAIRRTWRGTTYKKTSICRKDIFLSSVILFKRKLGSLILTIFCRTRLKLSCLKITRWTFNLSLLASKRGGRSANKFRKSRIRQICWLEQFVRYAWHFADLRFAYPTALVICGLKTSASSQTFFSINMTYNALILGTLKKFLKDNFFGLSIAE